jgi:hypothetical protein
VIVLKYKNKKTGMIWQNDDVEYVLNLIQKNSDFEIYEENKPVEEQEKPEGITAYIPKPKQNKAKK